MHSELFFDGKKYISSRSASRLTGYASDYVGQLARSGKVAARPVGRTWYILEESLLAHRARYAGNGVRNHPGKPSTPTPELSLRRALEQSVGLQAPEPTTTPCYGAAVLGTKARSGEEADATAKSFWPKLRLPTPKAKYPSRKIVFESDKWHAHSKAFDHSELVSKCATLAVSVALVFGPYLAKDSDSVRAAFAAARAGTYSIVGGVGGWTRELFEHPLDAVQFIVSESRGLPVASAEVGERLLLAGAAALSDIAGDVRETVYAVSDSLSAQSRALASMAKDAAGATFRAGRPFAGIMRETLSAVFELPAGAQSARVSFFAHPLAPFEWLARFTFGTLCSR